MQLGDKTRKTSTCDAHVTDRSVVQGTAAPDLVCIHCEKSIFEISPIHLTDFQIDSVFSQSLNFSENHNQLSLGTNRGNVREPWLLLKCYGSTFIRTFHVKKNNKDEY